ncbi:unnamed protein product, partial [Lymnaea stagnalis]
MYDKQNVPEVVKHICEELRLPSKFCQLVSADRSVCIVNDDWLKSLHRGHITSLSGADTIDTCKAERYLSRSCDKVPQPWVRMTIKAIAKSDELFEELPGNYLQKQWACGSLYEFM